MLKKKLKKIITYTLSIGLTLLLLVWVFRKVEFHKLVQDLQHINYIWVVVSIVLSIASHISRAMRWKMIMQPLGYSPRLSRVFMALMSGYFMNLIIPRAGEVTRCALLQKTENIPIDHGIGTVLVERLCDVIILGFLMLAGFFIEQKRLGEFFTKLLNEKFQHIQTNGLQIGLTVLAFISIVTLMIWMLRKRFMRSKLFAFITKTGKNVLAGIGSIRKVKNKRLFLLHTLFIWTMYFLASYVVIFSLSSTHNLPLTAGFSILLMGTISMATPVQGGTGVFHILVSSVLVLYGLPKEEGLVFATLLHLSQYLFMLLSGAICFVISLSIHRRQYGANAHIR